MKNWKERKRFINFSLWILSFSLSSTKEGEEVREERRRKRRRGAEFSTWELAEEARFGKPVWAREEKHSVVFISMCVCVCMLLELVHHCLWATVSFLGGIFFFFCWVCECVRDKVCVGDWVREIARQSEGGDGIQTDIERERWGAREINWWKWMALGSGKDGKQW